MYTYIDGLMNNKTHHVSLFDDVPPVLVDLCEPPALFRHLGHDVRRGEDGLQVQPRCLNLQPFIEDLLHQQ